MKRLLALLAIAAAPAPPAIHLDQIGYATGGAKRAIVADPATAPLAWQVQNQDGRIAASGVTRVVGDDPVSGDHVHQVDFSGVTAPGRYRLIVAGTASPAFAITPRPFAPLAKAALNYFYQTRAGIPIEARWAGGAQWARAAGHPAERVTCFAGDDERGNRWPGCGYTLDVTGGWYDAGDQGKYVVNGGIALWTLQNLYETHPGLFPDGSAALPEAGNGRNDLLDESRWEMRFLLAMQVPDGVMVAVPAGPPDASGKVAVTLIDAGGMAHHKVADRHWTALPTIPAQDREERLLYPPSTAATLNLAATAAQAARLWRTIDPAFAAQCLAAARRAWAAAERHPDILAAQGFTGSGGYGDASLADERYWAAAELLATTHEPGFAAVVRASPFFTAPVQTPGWSDTAALGTITLATDPTALPAAERAAQRARIVAAADGFVAEAARSPYGVPFAGGRYPWGSNGMLMDRAMLLGLAARFTGAARYRAAQTAALDYVLGRNPLDQSYVSGFGWRPLTNPHHRFWAHQIDPRLPGPPPGVLSGGANATAMADEVARTMQGHCAPQRCWRDDIRAYALNEVAINWNAPLVWVAADLDAAAISAAPATTG